MSAEKKDGFNITEALKRAGIWGALSFIAFGLINIAVLPALGISAISLPAVGASVKGLAADVSPFINKTTELGGMMVAGVCAFFAGIRRLFKK